MGLFSCFTGGKVNDTTGAKVPDYANNPRDWNFPIRIYGAGSATPGLMTVTRQIMAQQQLANMLDNTKK